jgi:hypothetical protein
MKIISIDVGVINFAYVYANVSANYENISVIDHNLINLMNYSICNCDLVHSNYNSSYMKHLFRDYSCMFDEADKIIVELQCPWGIKDIEQIIMFEYQHKTELVSPNAMHNHFAMSGYDRDQRKAFTTSYAETKLDLSRYSRKHDVADAYCQLAYYTSECKKIYKMEQIDKSKYVSDLQQFIYG